MSDDEDCPLCMEPFDVTDRNFFPCPCGYQICGFCWHRLRNESTGLCPACRRPFDEHPANFTPMTNEAFDQIKLDKKRREVERKQRDPGNRRNLQHIRVVQKNLVYVWGLPPRLGDEEVLRRNEYFGQYGRILKLVVTKNNSHNGSFQGPLISAYITYARKEDATAAIMAVDGLNLDSRTLRASFGTSKYCSAYMRYQTCHSADCMYLHEPADERDSYHKDELPGSRLLNPRALGLADHAISRDDGANENDDYWDREDDGRVEIEPAHDVPPPHVQEADPNNMGQGPALPASATWASKSASPVPQMAASPMATSPQPSQDATRGSKRPGKPMLVDLRKQEPVVVERKEAPPPAPKTWGAPKQSTPPINLATMGGRGRMMSPPIRLPMQTPPLLSMKPQPRALSTAPILTTAARARGGPPLPNLAAFPLLSAPAPATRLPTQTRAPATMATVSTKALATTIGTTSTPARASATIVQPADKKAKEGKDAEREKENEREKVQKEKEKETKRPKEEEGAKKAVENATAPSPSTPSTRQRKERGQRKKENSVSMEEGESTDGDRRERMGKKADRAKAGGGSGGKSQEEKEKESQPKRASVEVAQEKTTAQKQQTTQPLAQQKENTKTHSQQKEQQKEQTQKTAESGGKAAAAAAADGGKEKEKEKEKETRGGKTATGASKKGEQRENNEESAIGTRSEYDSEVPEERIVVAHPSKKADERQKKKEAGEGDRKDQKRNGKTEVEVSKGDSMSSRENIAPAESVIVGDMDGGAGGEEGVVLAEVRNGERTDVGVEKAERGEGVEGVEGYVYGEVEEQTLGDYMVSEYKEGGDQADDTEGPGMGADILASLGLQEGGDEDGDDTRVPEKWDHQQLTPSNLDLWTLKGLTLDANNTDPLAAIFGPTVMSEDDGFVERRSSGYVVEAYGLDGEEGGTLEEDDPMTFDQMQGGLVDELLNDDDQAVPQDQPFDIKELQRQMSTGSSHASQTPVGSFAGPCTPSGVPNSHMWDPYLGATPPSTSIFGDLPSMFGERKSLIGAEIGARKSSTGASAEAVNGPNVGFGGLFGSEKSFFGDPVLSQPPPVHDREHERGPNTPGGFTNQPPMGMEGRWPPIPPPGQGGPTQPLGGMQPQRGGVPDDLKQKMADDLRALIPGVNISFAPSAAGSQNTQSAPKGPPPPQGFPMPHGNPPPGLPPLPPPSSFSPWGSVFGGQPTNKEPSFPDWGFNSPPVRGNDPNMPPHMYPPQQQQQQPLRQGGHMGEYGNLNDFFMYGGRNPETRERNDRFSPRAGGGMPGQMQGLNQNSQHQHQQMMPQPQRQQQQQPPSHMQGGMGGPPGFGIMSQFGQQPQQTQQQLQQNSHQPQQPLPLHPPPTFQQQQQQQQQQQTHMNQPPFNMNFPPGPPGTPGPPGPPGPRYPPPPPGIGPSSGGPGSNLGPQGGPMGGWGLPPPKLQQQQGHPIGGFGGGFPPGLFGQSPMSQHQPPPGFREPPEPPGFGHGGGDPNWDHSSPRGYGPPGFHQPPFMQGYGQPGPYFPGGMHGMPLPPGLGMVGREGGLEGEQSMPGDRFSSINALVDEEGR